MNTVSVLDNLNNVDDFLGFVLAFEDRLELNEEELSSVKSASKSLDNLLIAVIFDLNKRLNNETESSFESFVIDDKLNNASKLLNNLFQFNKIKHYRDSFEYLKRFTLFTKTYQNSASYDSMIKLTHDEMRALKSKMLLITAERFS